MAPIEIAGLTHKYGKTTALRNLTLTVPEGSVYALLGPNGSGKTTLLQILTGMREQTAGSAMVLGKSVRQLNANDRTQLGYVAEGVRLPGWMTLAQLEAWLAPLYPNWDFNLAAELRERFALPTDRKLKSFSRGEHMKAALLVSLAPRPKLLLMDEPFTGIDALTKDELVRGLLETGGRKRWTVLVCTHDIAEIEPLADWVGLLDRGSLRLSEPMESVYARFKRVEVLTNGVAANLPTELPEDWLSVECAGQRLSFLTQEAASSDHSAIRLWVPQAAQIDVRPASLREVFVALAKREREEVTLS